MMAVFSPVADKIQNLGPWYLAYAWTSRLVHLSSFLGPDSRARPSP
jgi:hypothetical protein